MNEWAKLFIATILTLVVFGFCSANTPNTSPVDVPPIQEEYGNLGYNFCDMGQCVWRDAGQHWPLIPVIPYRRKRWTCADKTRFLMTSEDGKKHCIRLELR